MKGLVEQDKLERNETKQHRVKTSNPALLRRALVTVTETLYIEGVRQSDAGFWGLNQTPNQPVSSHYTASSQQLSGCNHEERVCYSAQLQAYLCNML